MFPNRKKKFCHYSISTEILTISTFSWSHFLFITGNNLPEKQYTHFIKIMRWNNYFRSESPRRQSFLFIFILCAKTALPKTIILNNWFLSFIKSHTQHSDRKISLRLLLIIFIIYGYGRWVNFFLHLDSHFSSVNKTNLLTFFSYIIYPFWTIHIKNSRPDNPLKFRTTIFMEILYFRRFG